MIGECVIVKEQGGRRLGSKYQKGNDGRRSFGRSFGRNLLSCISCVRHHARHFQRRPTKRSCILVLAIHLNHLRRGGAMLLFNLHH